MKYSAVIRTLGKSGDKFDRLIDSLLSQSIKPSNIIIYIAKGCEMPKNSYRELKFFFVDKGMLAQRALRYEEVETEYILFLDDDLILPNDFVKNMFDHLMAYQADVISPDVFPNDKRGLIPELVMTIAGRLKARRNDGIFGYKVMNTTGYSYNKNPKNPIYLSQTNAGACFLCRKQDFLKINLDEEKWLDTMPYAIGDDQVMFYKMHLLGLKQLTFFNSGIKHLDGGHNYDSIEKKRTIVANDFYFRRVFFQRFLNEPESKILIKISKYMSYSYFVSFSFLSSICKLDFDMIKRKYKALMSANNFIKSQEYRNIPKIKMR